MAKALLLVLAVSIAIGVIVGFVAGRLPGTGAFAAALVLGAVLVVLRRNQEDLRELEAGLPPGEVGDAMEHASRPER